MNWVQRKNIWKVIRSIIQGIILIILLDVIVHALFSFSIYEPFIPDEEISRDGFIAISYFGTDQEGDSTLISVSRLDEHLAALKKQGYVTITQQDVIDYYKNGKSLPEKSLLLMFEDGRRDTAIFSQPLLEKYNFKATALTYAEKFYAKDSKFLSVPDLKDLIKTSYWEMGTNGYRLYYINVFDRYDFYLGEMSTLEFNSLSSGLNRSYNHYLMDYVRDADGLPKESYSEMVRRITADYDGMAREYKGFLGEVPSLYVLMHANTGRFGNNDKVSAVNKENLTRIFPMTFNRETECWNTFDDDPMAIYDLTRMQPQSFWYANHLLMRVRQSNKQDVEFINGIEETYDDWSVLQGALECKPEKLVVTCEPMSKGLVRLNEGELWDDLELTVRMTGNKLGTQTIYLRADDQLESGLTLKLEDNVFIVEENDTEIFSLSMDEFDGKPHISRSEDEKAVRVRELESLLRYAKTPEDAAAYKEALDYINSQETTSVEDGDAEYIAKPDVHDPGSRKVRARLEGDSLTIWVDDRLMVENLKVSISGRGAFGLGSQWNDYNWSQRNLTDDVYDGVFEKLEIKNLNGDTLYDDVFHGVDAVWYKANVIVKTVVNWFIKNL